MLEWVGVERDAWIQRESVLEPEVGELRGMILVDLPDSDSTVQTHREVSDKVLPLADVVLWVTDPQKYADPGLRHRFIPAALENPGRMNVAVLNQVDTLVDDDVEQVALALTDLLVEGGLMDPVVALTSATEKLGTDELRELLVAQTAHNTVAMRRVTTGLAAEVTRLAATAQLDPATPPVLDRAWVARAAGNAVRVIAEAALELTLTPPPGKDGQPPKGQSAKGQPAKGLPGAAPLRPVTPGQDVARQVAAEWLVAATEQLPPVWAESVGYSLASAPNLVSRLTEALASVTAPKPPGFLARLFARASSQAKWRGVYLDRIANAAAPVVHRAMGGPTEVVLDDMERVGTLLAQAWSAANAS
jgi:hypothetical protein